MVFIQLVVLMKFDDDVAAAKSEKESIAKLPCGVVKIGCSICDFYNYL